MSAEINLTGFVTAGGSFVTIALNSPLFFEHDAKLHVRDEQGGHVHDYHALVGPDYETQMAASCQVTTQGTTGGATLNLTIGWTMLIGQWPIAETGLVTTSPQGTCMAVRIKQAPEQHYVYNLPSSDSIVPVRVKATGQTVNLQPGTYVVVTPNPAGALQAMPIPLGDPFVADMQQRAADAGLI